MAHTISVLGWRRPEYLAATLIALRRCIGIEKYRVFVLIDGGSTETLQAAVEESPDEWEVVASTRRAGCNQSTLRALRMGFAESEYHVHFEDDCLPAKDCLAWFEWARRFGDDQSIFSVSAYSREQGRLDEYGRRSWFTGWGWATWRNRFEEMQWPQEDKDPWDVQQNHHARRFRYEVYPLVARVQNIGREDGFNVHPDQWLRDQYNPSWAGESEVAEWVPCPSRC